LQSRGDIALKTMRDDDDVKTMWNVAAACTGLPSPVIGSPPHRFGSRGYDGQRRLWRDAHKPLILRFGFAALCALPAPGYAAPLMEEP
jgi:hypothetical protein